MLWSALGAMTAMWLMFTPALWPEQPLTSGLAAVVGLLALGFAVLGIASRSVRKGMAWLGLLLGLVNIGLGGGLGLGASLGLTASFAVSAVLLVAAGMSPTPEVQVVPATVTARPEPAAERQLPMAA